MMLTTPRCEGQIVYFVGIREARFFKAVLPGAVVELTGSVVSMRHGIVTNSMEAWTNGIRAAAATLSCTFRPHRLRCDPEGMAEGAH
jgi:3-hydroxymyristoyl/3-hydroxydecanoyl-(acyl carrier protein) dehydratase